MPVVAAVERASAGAMKPKSAHITAESPLHQALHRLQRVKAVALERPVADLHHLRQLAVARQL